MRKQPFRRAFEVFGLDVKFCDYVGALDLHTTALSPERSFRGYIAKAFDRFQDVLDHCVFLFCRGAFPESRWSASLVFIGQRVS
jgi:hypothetical protein